MTPDQFTYDSDPFELVMGRAEAQRLHEALSKYLAKPAAPMAPVVEIYSHPECAFHYCPSPDTCKANSGCHSKRRLDIL